MAPAARAPAAALMDLSASLAVSLFARRALNCTLAGDTVREPASTSFCTPSFMPLSTSSAGSAALTCASSTRTDPLSRAKSRSSICHGCSALAGLASLAARGSAAAVFVFIQRCTFHWPSRSRATATAGCSNFTLPSNTLRAVASTSSSRSANCLSARVGSLRSSLTRKSSSTTSPPDSSSVGWLAAAGSAPEAAPLAASATADAAPPAAHFKLPAADRRPLNFALTTSAM